jgi:hypothetical protein
VHVGFRRKTGYEPGQIGFPILTGVDLWIKYAGYRLRVERNDENLCAHLRHAIRVTSTEAFPANLRELGFDAACVKTA